MIIIQPSASRTTNPRAPIPKLLGYYHSSALRTDNIYFGQSPVVQILNEERDRPNKLRPVSLFDSLFEHVIDRGGLEIRIDVGLGSRVLSCVIGECLVKILSIANMFAPCQGVHKILD